MSCLLRAAVIRRDAQIPSCRSFSIIQTRAPPYYSELRGAIAPVWTAASDGLEHKPSLVLDICPHLPCTAPARSTTPGVLLHRRWARRCRVTEAGPCWCCTLQRQSRRPLQSASEP